jgi:uncharacterized protein YbjT (DUF2867 family)
VIGADWSNTYDLGQRHRQAERLVEWSDIPHVILRPNMFMQNFIPAHGRFIRMQSEFYAPAGTGPVSMIDARDVAAAGVEALTNERLANRAFTLTGPEAITHAQVADILSKEVGMRIKYVEVQEDTAKQATLEAGASRWFTEAMIELYQFLRSGRLSSVTRDFQMLTRREPSSFESFARDYADKFITEKERTVVRTPS